MEGLIYCDGSWDNSFCIVKLIEATISGILILSIAGQVIADIRHQGKFIFGFVQTVQALMFFTLVCTHNQESDNIIFSMDHQLDIFYYLQSLFYDWYFCTLVFYVTYKILTKSQASKQKIRCLIIIFIVLLLFFVILFVFSVLQQIKECEEVWFVVLDCVGLLICIGLIFADIKASRLQKLETNSKPSLQNVDTNRNKCFLSDHAASIKPNLPHSIRFKLQIYSSNQFPQTNRTQQSIELSNQSSRCLVCIQALHVRSSYLSSEDVDNKNIRKDQIVLIQQTHKMQMSSNSNQEDSVLTLNNNILSNKKTITSYEQPHNPKLFSKNL